MEERDWLLLMRDDLERMISVEGGRISFGMKEEQCFLLERIEGSKAALKFKKLQVSSGEVKKFIPDSLCFLCVVQQKVVGQEPGAEWERKQGWPWEGRITEQPWGHSLVGDHICKVPLCYPTPAGPWDRCGSGEGTQLDWSRNQNQGRGSRKTRQDRRVLQGRMKWRGPQRDVEVKSWLNILKKWDESRYQRSQGALRATTMKG